MFKENTILSDLDNISKKEFINKVEKHKTKYKSNLKLSKEMKFGIEIELLGDDFSKFECPYFNDSKWHLGYDATLPKPIGRELQSPIFKDNKKSHSNIKMTLLNVKKFIKQPRINDKCSCQLHFDASIFNENPELLFSFMVLLAETEPVLTKFFNGEYNNTRSLANIWAKQFTELFLKRLPLNKESYYDLLNSFYTNPCDFKRYAFDFSRLYLKTVLNDNYIQNTFENRLPNGTLNPVTIQNNIMLTGHLIMHAINNYDYEKGLYNIKSFDRNNLKLDIDKAFYVADILPNNEFKLDFLKQYKK